MKELTKVIPQTFLTPTASPITAKAQPAIQRTQWSAYISSIFHVKSLHQGNAITLRLRTNTPDDDDIDNGKDNARDDASNEYLKDKVNDCSTSEDHEYDAHGDTAPFRASV